MQEQMHGAHHEDTQQVHVSIAGAGATEILVVLQDVPARLQRLPERADVGLPLTELLSHSSPVRHGRGCRMQEIDCRARQECSIWKSCDQELTTSAGPRPFLRQSSNLERCIDLLLW